MSLFSFANFSPVFADIVLPDLVCRFYSAFRRSLFIPVYNEFDVSALTNVTGDFASDILDRFSLLWLTYWFSRFCLMRVC